MEDLQYEIKEVTTLIVNGEQYKIVDAEKVYDAGQKAMHSLWLNQSITELNEPEVKAIGHYQFYGFSQLTKAVFPNVTTTGRESLRDCTALTEVHLPLLVTVEEGVLRNIGAVILDLPSVTAIKATAFAYTNKMIALILRSSTLCTLANTNAFTNTKVATGNGAYIYVPSALVDTYKSATNWSTYASRFRALEEYTVDGTTTGELDESKI